MLTELIALIKQLQFALLVMKNKENHLGKYVIFNKQVNVSKVSQL